MTKVEKYIKLSEKHKEALKEHYILNNKLIEIQKQYESKKLTEKEVIREFDGISKKISKIETDILRFAAKMQNLYPSVYKEILNKEEN